MNYFYITGTGKGLGKALAELLLEDDDTFVYGISREKNIIHENYGHYFLDLNNLEAVKEFRFDKTRYLGNEEVVLINNAGVIGDIKPFGEVEADDIIYNYNVNIVSPSILINRFLHSYRKFTGQMTIINISSGAGRHVIESLGTYCASKAALDMLSRVVDAEQKKVSPNNPVQVFSIAPGIVDTNMQTELRGASPEYFMHHEKFVNYKKSDLLSRPKEAAQQILDIYNNRKNQKDVLLDVRD